MGIVEANGRQGVIGKLLGVVRVVGWVALALCVANVETSAEVRALDGDALAGISIPSGEGEGVAPALRIRGLALLTARGLFAGFNLLPEAVKHEQRSRSHDRPPAHRLSVSRSAAIQRCISACKRFRCSA